MIIQNDLKSINITTEDYINAELNIINRYKKLKAVDILEWVDKFAIKYHDAVMKIKKLDTVLIEEEVYK